MTRARLLHLLMPALLCLFSCNGSSHKELEREKIISEVRHTLVRYQEDIGKRGLLAEFDYLDSSAEFFWVPPGYSSWLSYDSIAFILRERAGMVHNIRNTWDTLMITPLTGDMAVYTGIMRGSSSDSSGKASSYRLIETGTLVKRKEGWKLLCGQTSVLP